MKAWKGAYNREDQQKGNMDATTLTAPLIKLNSLLEQCPLNNHKRPIQHSMIIERVNPLLTILRGTWASVHCK